MSTMSDLDARVRALASEHGKNVASWRFDGNTNASEHAECVRMDEEGDPAWDDTFGARAPLSGEWADELTPAALTGALSIDADSDLADEACKIYEATYYEAYRDEVLRVAREMTTETDA